MFKFLALVVVGLAAAVVVGSAPAESSTEDTRVYVTTVYEDGSIVLSDGQTACLSHQLCED